MLICSPVPIPSFNSLYALIPNPLPSFSIPSLPCLPSPIYANIIHPQLEIINLVHEIQTYQFYTTFLFLFTPIVNFLGLSLSSILPKIPVININLLDLLTLNPSSIYALIGNIPNISLPTFPALPIPIFQNLLIPEIELLNKVKFITTGYMTLLITTISSLIGTVTDQLHLPGLPTLPTIPSFASLQSLLLAPFSGFSNLLGVLHSGVSITDLFNITIPGFPALPALPFPLMPNFVSPEIYLMETLKIMNAELASYPMTLIVNFCTNTLGSLGFSFPTLCVPI